MNFFRTLLTGKDNASYEIIKLVIVIMLFSFIFVLYEGVSYYLKAFDSAKTFDILTLFNATGVIYSAFTLFLAGCAGALKWKQSTEPDIKDNSNAN